MKITVIGLSAMLVFGGCSNVRKSRGMRTPIGALNGLTSGIAIVSDNANDTIAREGSADIAVKEFSHLFVATCLFYANPVAGGIYLGITTAYGSARGYFYKHRKINFKLDER